MEQAAGALSGKKLFLHIGMEKTGTTAIQGFLQLNLAVLPKLGVYVADPELRTGSVLLHHRLAKACLTNQHIAAHIPAADEKEWSGWLAGFQASDSPIGIISSELFSYATPEDIAGIAERLKHFDVDVIVYLRRQDSYVEAQYGQHIKGIYQLGGVPFSREKFLPGNLNYDIFCGAWAFVFGVPHIRVRLYDEEAEAQALYRNFCEVIGIPMERLALPVHTVNPGIMEFQARVLLALQGAIQDGPTRAAIAQHVLNYNNKIAEKRSHSGRPKWLIPRERREQILRMSDASNAQVARIYLGREDGVLFPIMTEEEAVVAEAGSIDYKEIALLLEYMYTTLSK